MDTLNPCLHSASLSDSGNESKYAALRGVATQTSARAPGTVTLPGILLVPRWLSPLHPHGLEPLTFHLCSVLASVIRSRLSGTRGLPPHTVLERIGQVHPAWLPPPPRGSPPTRGSPHLRPAPSS